MADSSRHIPCLTPWRWAAACAIAFVAERTCATPPNRIIWFGNSLSNYNSPTGTAGSPDLVRFIAIAAGYQPPYMQSRCVNGADLAYHLNSPWQLAAITGSLPIGVTWDAAVIQGATLETTAPLGNLPVFRANAVSLASAVRSHSPDAQVVLFETYARQPLHSYYPSYFANAAAFQAQVVAGYASAMNDINAGDAPLGPVTASIAPVGRAFEDRGFDIQLYASDLWHPSAKGSVLTAITIFETLYNDTASRIILDADDNGLFDNPGGLLELRLAYLGITPAEWADLADAHDPDPGEPLAPLCDARVVFDFGPAATMSAAPVNNITPPTGAPGETPWSVLGATDMNGVATPVWLTVSPEFPFNPAGDTTGLAATTAFASRIPHSATSDSLFGSLDEVGGVATGRVVITIGGLDPSMHYTLWLYASTQRTDQAPQVTMFTLQTGAGLMSDSLNSQGNQSSEVVFENVQPRSDGTIGLSPDVGMGNLTPEGMFNLGALAIVPDVPGPCTFPCDPDPNRDGRLDIEDLYRQSRLIVDVTGDGRISADDRECVRERLRVIESTDTTAGRR